MISKKQYLKAQNIIKKYENQLLPDIHNDGNKSNDKQTIILDDTDLCITMNDLITKIVNDYEFSEILDILFTEKQHKEFIGDCTNREFEISNKKISKMFMYIHSTKNPWRMQKK